MNTKVGVDVTVEKIKACHDIVYFETGAWRQPVFRLDGEKLTSFSLNFLKEIKKGFAVEIKWNERIVFMFSIGYIRMFAFFIIEKVKYTKIEKDNCI